VIKCLPGSRNTRSPTAMTPAIRTTLPGPWVERWNTLLARLIIVAFGTFLIVAGATSTVRHLLRPEIIAQVRLEKAGYAVEPAAVFEAIERRDSLALVRLQTAGVSLVEARKNGVTAYEVALLQDRLDMLDTLEGLGVAPDLETGVFDGTIARALGETTLDTVSYVLERGGDPDLEVEADMPALVWAMAAGKRDLVDLLLESGADIRTESRLGTPLWVAYSQGDYQLFDRFLDMGADAHQLDRSGRYLGTRSVVDGKDRFARRLLAAGADPNGVGRDSLSMTEAAFRKRNEPLFVELVQAGGDLQAVDEAGRTYLERTAADRDYAWMELLLAQGVDPNQRTASYGDPLWWNRFEQGDAVGAELLLAAGANINERDASGVSPLEHAIRRDRFRMTRYLFSRGAETYEELWDPLRDRNYDMVRLIVANGADVNNPTSVGITPLAYTIMGGDLTGAALLMEYGARYEPGARPNGHTLLEWALANKQLPMIEWLIKQGAEVNEAVRRPLHSDFIEKFEEHGNLSYYLRKDSNVTPLMVAAGSHQLEAARLLLENGAKRYSYTRRNRTYPVTFAIRSENLPMAQLMLGREPETDGNYERKIVVNRSQQRARLYRNGELIYSTRCSTGKSGYRTPVGTFVITDKSRLRHSTIYGSAMPYFQRLSGSAVGMHQGYVPGYPVSHGCIRLPYTYAKKFYATTRVGDIIIVE